MQDKVEYDKRKKKKLNFSKEISFFLGIREQAARFRATDI